MPKDDLVSLSYFAATEDTPQERILDGALRVFAERGFPSATLREITELVAVNIAAVNYYYGSKDRLIRAVLIRYVKPIVDARRAALDELMARKRRPTVREVVETLVYPMVRHSRDKWGGRSVISLLLQTRALPNAELQDIVAELFDPITHRFTDAFMRANPRLTRAEGYWRYNFALGAIMQVLTDTNPATQRLERLSAGLCRADDKIVAAQLVDFISLGFRSSAAPHRNHKPTKPATSRRAKANA